MPRREARLTAAMLTLRHLIAVHPGGDDVILDLYGSTMETATFDHNPDVCQALGEIFGPLVDNL
jgi:hypothetical protein